jgi:putative phage-type endonuclease
VTIQPTGEKLELTRSVTAFADGAEWTGVRDDDREAWLAMRATLVTASDVAAIIGENPHRSPLAVYVDKITRKAQERLRLDDPRFWGHVLEQPVLQAVADFYGWGYRRGGYLLRSRRWPVLGCTLDAEIDRGAGWIPLEGKTTRVPAGWSEKDGDMPVWVLCQTQAQLAVTQAQRALTFALLQGSRPVFVEVDADAEFHAIIAEAAEEILERVRNLDPPPAGATDKEVLQRLHPTEDGSIIELAPEVTEWTRELQDLASRRLEIQRHEELLRNRIRQLLATATYGVLPEPVGGKQVWKCATESRPEHQVAASSSRVLRAVKALPNKPRKKRRI